jgi:hypothetical protein
MNTVYTGLTGLKLAGYAYLIDLKEAPTASTATYGLRAEWHAPLGNGFAANLTGAFAHQSDYGGNPNHVSLDYWALDGQIAYEGFAAGVGDEAMQGNGIVGFATPLATLHAFDGWADLFLTTPKNGIDDLHARLSYTQKDAFGIASLTPQIVYHSFTTDRTDTGIGQEWDMALTAAFDRHFSVEASYAAYDGAGLSAGGFKDKSVTWLTADYRY